jgi:hypothetical protein
VRTVLAALNMAAERGSATILYCPHHASLSQIHVASIGHAPRPAMAAEDVRHLKLRAEHVRALLSLWGRAACRGLGKNGIPPLLTLLYHPSRARERWLHLTAYTLKD